MSSAGIHADVLPWGPQDRAAAAPALMIGALVPRLHHSDGKPVYLVVEHELGASLGCKDGQTRRLLAYPSDWPGPGEFAGRYIYARHERLPWDGPVPIYDLRNDTLAAA